MAVFQGVKRVRNRIPGDLRIMILIELTILRDTGRKLIMVGSTRCARIDRGEGHLR